MTNPWITHLKKYHAEHPQNSYRENMSKARPSYKPVQKGGNPALLAVAKSSGEIAKASADITKSGAEVGQSVISSAQTNRKATGADTAKVVRRRANLYKKYKRMMSKNRFPEMSDAKLWDYINREVNAT